MIDTDTYLDTTYTIRRLGCAAWREHVPAHKLEDELRHANDTVSGHVVIGESGPLEGEVVDVTELLEAVREAQS